MSETEKWAYIIETLIGGMGYEGLVRWLSIWPDLDSAYQTARHLREGMPIT